MSREVAKAHLTKKLDRDPDDAGSWLELARLCFSTGDDAQGRSAASRVPPDHPSYPRALLWTVKYHDPDDKSDLDDKVEELANLLIAQGSCKLLIELVRLLNGWGYHGVSESLLVTFMRQHGSVVSSYLLLVRTLFSGGRYELAWQASKWIWPNDEHSVSGKIGPIPFQRSHPERPYAEIKDQIDACVAAANLADADIQPYPLGGGEADLDNHRDASILLVGPETNNEVFENEVLTYYASSARECGLDVRAHLDDVIVYPENTRTSDAEAMKRLTERIVDSAPSLLIVDATYIARSWTITPEYLDRMQRQHKSRVAVIIRDCPHAGLHVTMPWAEVADVIIVFEPRAAILDTVYRAKTLVLPPPFRNAFSVMGKIQASATLPSCSPGPRLVFGR